MSKKAQTKSSKPSLKVALPAVVPVLQNGIARPAKSYKDGRTRHGYTVWKIADQISARKKRPATREEVCEQCIAQGIPNTTWVNQFYFWRKFNGLEGTRKEKLKLPRASKTKIGKPVSKPATKPEAKTASKPVEKPADKAKKPVAKAAKPAAKKPIKPKSSPQSELPFPIPSPVAVEAPSPAVVG